MLLFHTSEIRLSAAAIMAHGVEITVRLDNLIDTNPLKPSRGQTPISANEMFSREKLRVANARILIWWSASSTNRRRAYAVPNLITWYEKNAIEINAFPVQNVCRTSTALCSFIIGVE